VPITTKVVSSNPAHGEVCYIQHYVIKFVSDLRQVGGLRRGTQLYSTNKTEILLKVVFNTIPLILTLVLFILLYFVDDLLNLYCSLDYK